MSVKRFLISVEQYCAIQSFLSNDLAYRVNVEPWPSRSVEVVAETDLHAIAFSEVMRDLAKEREDLFRV